MTIVINKRVAHITLAVLAAGALLWLAGKWLAPGKTIIDGDRLTALDPDNKGINIRVNRPWFSDSVMVFDVGRPADRDFDRLDVTRCLLQCAQDLKDEPLSRIYLANNGERLYYIPGDDFKALGNQYSRGSTWNNTKVATRVPVVTYTLNDSLAFQRHDGWLNAVDNADDLNTMMGALLRDEKQSLTARVWNWVW